jgi:hypothetical protein
VGRPDNLHPYKDRPHEEFLKRQSPQKNPVIPVSSLKTMELLIERLEIPA